MVVVGQAGVATQAPFEQVYRDHFGFVFSSLLRLGVPPAAVDDATQDVFITVHRQLPGFEGRSALRSWLFGIARRIAFRHRRSAQRLLHRTEALAAAPTVAPEGPVESLEHAQRGRLLLRALDDLDEDKRAALTLHVFEEMPGPELAQMLGVNVDTAYSRIKAARRELRRALVALGVEADAEAVIAEARRATRPDPTARQRVAGLLAVRLGTGAGKVAVAGSTAAASFAGTKGVLGAIALGAAITVGVGVGERLGGAREDGPRNVDPRNVDPRNVDTRAAAAPTEPRADRGSPPAEFPASSATPPASPVVEPTSEAEPGSTVPARATAPSPTPAPTTDAVAAALAEEVALITAAKSALDAGTPERALVHLEAHAARFADGQLATERAGYRAIASCAAGQLVAGRGQARVFLARHGGVTLAGRVRDACGLNAEEKKSPAP